jgi:hypothetical protein
MKGDTTRGDPAAAGEKCEFDRVRGEWVCCRENMAGATVCAPRVEGELKKGRSKGLHLVLVALGLLVAALLFIL